MIGVTVCGNIIPFIYHVLGTNAIIKGFMQYVVVVCFIRAACLVVIISAAGIKGEFVGSIESEFLIDSICIEACRSYFPGFFQFMSFGVLLVWIQLPSLGLLTAVRGVGAELAGIDIYVYGLGKTSFTGITGIAGNIDSIFCIISNRFQCNGINDYWLYWFIITACFYSALKTISSRNTPTPGWSPRAGS